MVCICNPDYVLFWYPGLGVRAAGKRYTYRDPHRRRLLTPSWRLRCLQLRETRGNRKYLRSELQKQMYSRRTNGNFCRFIIVLPVCFRRVSCHLALREASYRTVGDTGIPPLTVCRAIYNFCWYTTHALPRY